MDRAFLILATLCLLCSTGVAQQHVFTNKKGVQIIAEIVSVEPDWKMMTIRKDGNSFDLAPQVLVLDDQQYVKNWLKERGITAPVKATPGSASTEGSTPPASTFDVANSKISVELKKKQVDYDRVKYSSYIRLDTRQYNYDISVTNGGRESVPPVVVSYALVWKEGVSFPADTVSYSRFSSSRDRFAITGEASFPSLVYNRTVTMTTKPVEINNVNYDGNEHYEEDIYLGTVVNVSLADGTLLTEYQDTDARNNNLTWETVKGLSSNPLSSSSRVDMDDEVTYNFQLKKGQSEDGPIQLTDKRVKISAKIQPEVQSSDGVIVAIGGATAGVTLFVKDRQVYAGVRTPEGFRWVSKPTPLGNFTAEMELNKQGLSLTLDGGSAASRADVDLLNSITPEGVEVGTDSGTLVGDYPPNFTFSGAIEDVKISIQ
ncbi:MAG: hypothetical protein P1V20_12520 [Verrucomicrobiales bacterium]|nr:hypothetical protein [Verrucomicrobiales bacterium]